MNPGNQVPVVQDDVFPAFYQPGRGNLVPLAVIGRRMRRQQVPQVVVFQDGERDNMVDIVPVKQFARPDTIDPARCVQHRLVHLPRFPDVSFNDFIDIDENIADHFCRFQTLA